MQVTMPEPYGGWNPKSSSTRFMNSWEPGACISRTTVFPCQAAKLLWKLRRLSKGYVIWHGEGGCLPISNPPPNTTKAKHPTGHSPNPWGSPEVPLWILAMIFKSHKKELLPTSFWKLCLHDKWQNILERSPRQDPAKWMGEVQEYCCILLIQTMGSEQDSFLVDYSELLLSGLMGYFSKCQASFSICLLSWHFWNKPWKYVELMLLLLELPMQLSVLRVNFDCIRWHPAN